jgi:hypothetical protein
MLSIPVAIVTIATVAAYAYTDFIGGDPPVSSGVLAVKVEPDTDDAITRESPGFVHSDDM